MVGAGPKAPPQNEFEKKSVGPWFPKSGIKNGHGLKNQLIFVNLFSKRIK